MAGTGSVWVPRRDLALPNELLHKIIILLIADCVHTVCVSPDNLWEKSVMDILSDVSPAFRAISCEIAATAFNVPPHLRDDDRKVQQTVRAKFIYLAHLRDRFGADSVWHSTFNQTLDSDPQLDPFVVSYAKYFSCVCLRRSMTNSHQGQLFGTLYNFVVKSLERCEEKANTVYPPEITSKLRECIASEYKLSQHSLALVQAFTGLKNHASAMRVWYPGRVGSYGPISALFYIISCSLERLEKALIGYTEACQERLPEPEPKITEFPDAIDVMRDLYFLEYVEDPEYNLGPRVRSILAKLSLECPYLEGVPLTRVQDDINIASHNRHRQ